MAEYTAMAKMISVIIPTLGNRPQYLAEQLEAISSQSYTNYEVLLVAPGFDVSLPEYIPGTFLLQEGLGIADAVNLGLRWAQGDIITWQNDDDIVAPRAFEYAVEVLADHEWMYGRCDMIDADGQSDDLIFGGEDWNMGVELVRNLCPQPSVYWTHKAASEVGLFDDDVNAELAADYDYWIRLGQRYEPYVTQTVMSKYRSWPGSISVHSLGSQNAHADYVRRKYRV